jgi:N-acetylmuramoyl-L-alanine amidase
VYIPLHIQWIVKDTPIVMRNRKKKLISSWKSVLSCKRFLKIQSIPFFYGFGLYIMLMSPTFAITESLSLKEKTHTTIKNLWIDPTSEKNGAIISLLLSDSAPFHAFTSRSPHCLIIDVPTGSLLAALKSELSSKNLVFPSSLGLKDYKHFIVSENKTRFVFTFSHPVTIENSDSLEGPEGSRILIALKQTVPERSEGINPLIKDNFSPSQHRKPLIIIDPGHGGEDPGAETSNGQKEKEIVLEIAHHLRKLLGQSKNLDVVLTRAEDRFISLSDRVRIAREKGASLFISLHADALPSASSVNGITIYTLSSVASDKEAERLAERENLSALLRKDDLQSEEEDIQTILMDFTTRETRMLSIAFSEKLIQNWRGQLTLNKTPLRSANFFVLKAPDVPSVLIEIAYLSNTEDQERLASDVWRHTLIEGIERSIQSYVQDKKYLEHVDVKNDLFR